MSRVVIIFLTSAVLLLAWRLLLVDRRPLPEIAVHAPIPEMPKERPSLKVKVDPKEVEDQAASALKTLTKILETELPAANAPEVVPADQPSPDEAWGKFRRTPVDLMEYAAWRPLAHDADDLFRSLQLNPRDYPMSEDVRHAIDRDLKVYEGVLERILDCIGSVRVSEASARLRSGLLTSMTRDLDPELWDRIVGRSGPARLAELTDPNVAMEAAALGPSLKSSLHSAFMREHNYYATVFVDSTTYLVRLDDVPLTKALLENGEIDYTKVMRCTYILDAFQRAGCLTLDERDDLWRLFLLYMEEYKRSVAKGFIPNPHRSLLKKAKSK
jgi:hypothetical protein